MPLSPVVAGHTQTLLAQTSGLRTDNPFLPVTLGFLRLPHRHEQTGICNLALPFISSESMHEAINPSEPEPHPL